MNNYLENCKAYQPELPYDFNISLENSISADDLSRTVCEVVEGINIFKYVSFKNRRSYGYDPLMMLRLVTLAFALFGFASTRYLESLCRHDIRFIFIARNQRPSHQSFHRFIHDDLKVSVEEFFYDVNRYIEKNDDQINTDVLYIDGSKWEADAGKMTFVWKKATLKFKTKLWKKTMKQIRRFNQYLESQDIPVRFSVLKEMSLGYLIEITDTIQDIMKSRSISFVHGRGHKKHELQKHYDFFKEAALKFWKYAMHLDICQERNSFSKTDPDATFMHMKYDYYNHTNVFKPEYNVQIGVSDHYIRHIYISGDAADIKTYIPFMESYHEAYGTYPSCTPADAGYGSYDNYRFCKENGIELYMKYNTITKEQEKITDKNRFKSWMFPRDEDGGIRCPAGHIMTVEKETVETRGVYERTNQLLGTGKCTECPFKRQCTKSKNGRKVTFCSELENYHTEVRNNLSTPEGRELLKQRSIQSEGCFGILKEDFKYDRLHRTGESGVRTEFYLVAIGHNLRRFHKKKMEIVHQVEQIRRLVGLN